MKTRRVALGFLIIALTLLFAGIRGPRAAESARGEGQKIRVLLVHGGHDFETNRFLGLFEQMPGTSFRAVEHPKAQGWFGREHSTEYDVLVFYDMLQTISEQAKRDLMDRLQEGKGLVALHHCLASFQGWEEYPRIIGGRYHLKAWQDHGVEKPGSTYLHDVDFKVHVVDPKHPVTQGIADFAIHDETYGGFEVNPDVHVLLTTDAPTSGPKIAWAHRYGPARVVYIQLGHDHQAWENPNYQRLLKQAIEWAAQRR